MFILIIVTIVSFMMLVRSMLILMGVYKTPVIHSFEEYGPEEKPFLPGITALLWSGIVIFSASLWATRLSSLSFTLSTLGVLMLIAAGAGYNYSEKTAKYHWKILRFPRWYCELVDRTTRYERRRIAYMWLTLPKRLRLTYNSSDLLFFIWADFVIMGTIREEEEVPGQNDSIIYYVEPKIDYVPSARKKEPEKTH
jgi:hypothetical protein